MVVTKKLQDSQMDSKWQSISDGSGAIAVAEHAPVHLGAELAHLVALVVAGESAGLIVERFNFRQVLESFLRRVGRQLPGLYT